MGITFIYIGIAIIIFKIHNILSMKSNILMYNNLNKAALKLKETGNKEEFIHLVSNTMGVTFLKLLGSVVTFWWFVVGFISYTRLEFLVLLLLPFLTNVFDKKSEFYREKGKYIGITVNIIQILIIISIIYRYGFN